MEKRNRKAGSRYSLRDRILAQIMIVLITVTMLPYESLVVHAASTTTVKSIGGIETEYEVEYGTSKDDIGLPSSLSVTIETATSAEGATEETAPAVSEETVDKSVSWKGNYDGNTAGDYALTAEFDDSSLSYSKMPTVHVTVREKETTSEGASNEAGKTEDAEDGDDDGESDQPAQSEEEPVQKDEEETKEEVIEEEEEAEEAAEEKAAPKEALKSPPPANTVTGREHSDLRDFAPDNMTSTLTLPNGDPITEDLEAGDLFNVKLEFHETPDGIQFDMDTLRYTLPNGAKAVPPLSGVSTVTVRVIDQETGHEEWLDLDTTFTIEQSSDPKVADVIVYEWNHDPNDTYEAMCAAENVRISMSLQMMVNGEGEEFEFEDNTQIPVDLSVDITVIKQVQINGDYSLTAADKEQMEFAIFEGDGNSTIRAKDKDGVEIPSWTYADMVAQGNNQAKKVFSGLKKGTYTVKEISTLDIDDYTFSSSSVTKATDTIPASDERTYTLTNVYVQDSGSLKLKKNFASDSALNETNMTKAQREAITFTVTGPGGFSNVYTYDDIYKADGELTLSDLAVGEYTVTETSNIPGYECTSATFAFTVDGQPSGTGNNGGVIDVEKDKVSEALFTNSFRQRTGSLTLTKEFTGNAVTDALKNQISFTITGPNNYSRTVTYAELTNGSKTITDLPIGTYTIKEIRGNMPTGTQVRTYINGSSSAAASPFQATASVTDGGTASASYRNDYRQVGSLKITKQITCDNNNYVTFARFRSKNPKPYIRVTGPNGYDSGKIQFNASGFNSGTYTINNLPVGNYTVTEYDGSYSTNYTFAVTYTGDVSGTETTTPGTSTVPQGGVGQVTVHNDYKRNKGKINIEKALSGDITSIADFKSKFSDPNTVLFTISNGDYSFEIKVSDLDDNGKVSKEVPTSSKAYEIKEINADLQNYIRTTTVTLDGSSSTNPTSALVSTKGQEHTVVFNNKYTKTGKLKLDKTVVGLGGAAAEELKAQLRFEILDESGSVVTVDGKSEFTLAEMIKGIDLPVGNYQVREKNDIYHPEIYTHNTQTDVWSMIVPDGGEIDRTYGPTSALQAVEYGQETYIYFWNEYHLVGVGVSLVKYVIINGQKINTDDPDHNPFTEEQERVENLVKNSIRFYIYEGSNTSGTLFGVYAYRESSITPEEAAAGVLPISVLAQENNGLEPGKTYTIEEKHYEVDNYKASILFQVRGSISGGLVESREHHATFTVTAGGVITIDVTNGYEGYGNLVVKKTFGSDSQLNNDNLTEDQKKAIQFTVTGYKNDLIDDQGNPQEGNTTVFGPETFSYYDMTEVDGVFQKEFKEVHTGVYIIKETNAAGISNLYNCTTTQDPDGNIVVDLGGEEEITFNNTYTRKLGSLVVEKTFAGDPLNSDCDLSKMTFTVTGPDGYTATKTYDEFTDGKWTINNLPTGTYTVKETGADYEDQYYERTTTVSVNGGAETSYSETAGAAGTVDENETLRVNLINTYKEVGALVFNKIFDDDEVVNNLTDEQKAAVAFTVKDSNGTAIASITYAQIKEAVEAGEPGYKILVDAPADYTIIESADFAGYERTTTVQVNGQSATYDDAAGVSAHVNKFTSSTVEFTNEYKEHGKLVVTKVITYTGSLTEEQQKAIKFTVKDPDGNVLKDANGAEIGVFTYYDMEKDSTGKRGSKVFENLPAGRGYTITEEVLNEGTLFYGLVRTTTITVGSAITTGTEADFDVTKNNTEVLVNNNYSNVPPLTVVKQGGGYPAETTIIDDQEYPIWKFTLNISNLSVATTDNGMTEIKDTYDVLFGDSDLGTRAEYFRTLTAAEAEDWVDDANANKLIPADTNGNADGTTVTITENGTDGSTIKIAGVSENTTPNHTLTFYLIPKDEESLGLLNFSDDQDEAGQNSEEVIKSFNNNIQYKELPQKDWTTQKTPVEYNYRFEMLHKECENYDAERKCFYEPGNKNKVVNYAVYRIIMNPEAKWLGSPNQTKVDCKDTFSDNQYVDESSIKFYVLNNSQLVETTVDYNMTGNVITFKIDNGKRYEMTYQSEILYTADDLHNTMEVTNLMQMNNKWVMPEAEFVPTSLGDATVDYIKLRKADKDKNNVTLAGATFELYGSVADAEAERNCLGTYTTNAKGICIIEEYSYTDESGTHTGHIYADKNKTWALREVVAPPGYELIDYIVQVRLADRLAGETADPNSWIYLPSTAVGVKDKPYEGVVEFGALKNLIGSNVDIAAGDYKFTLTGVNGAPTGTAASDEATAPTDPVTVENDANGKARFGSIKFKTQDLDPIKDGNGKITGYKKTFNYTIKEVQGDKAGITYDTTEHPVEVTVTANDETEVLDVVVKIDGKTVTAGENNVYFANISNEYNAEGHLVLGARKTIAGRKLRVQEFTFEAKLNDADDTVVSAQNVEEHVIDLYNCDIVFPQIDYVLDESDAAGYTNTTKVVKKDGKYTVYIDPDVLNKTDGDGHRYVDYQYTIKEAKNNPPQGVTMDETEYDVTVRVTDLDNGKLKIVVLKNGSILDPAEFFSNFVFKNYYNAEGEAKPEGKKFVKDDGQALAAGTYEFNVYDLTDGEKLIGKVTHAASTAGSAGAAIQFPTISAEVRPTAKDDELGMKVITGNDGYVKEIAITYRNIEDFSDENGNLKEFKFRFNELHGGEIREGIQYSNASYDVTATVTMNKNDESELDVNLSKTKELDFTNTPMGAEGQATPEGKKVLNGRKLKEGEFTFDLYYGDTVIGHVTNAAGGQIKYPVIKFVLDAAGTEGVTVDSETDTTLVTITVRNPGKLVGPYTFTVKENSDNPSPGIVYPLYPDDRKTFTATAKMKEGSNEEIEVTLNNANSLNFINTYGAAGEETAEGKKVLEGRDLEAKEFWFGILDANNSEIGKVTNDRNGKIQYPTFRYVVNPNGTPGRVTETANGALTKVTITVKNVEDLAATEYTVYEIEESEDGITYDTSTRQKITVTPSVNPADASELIVSVEAEKGKVFTNTFEAAGQAKPSGYKELTNRLPVEEDEFQFEIKEGDAHIATVGLTDTLSDDHKKTRIDYPTFKYTVDANKEAGTTYDEDTNTITVNVQKIEDIASPYKYTVKEVIPAGAEQTTDGQYIYKGVTYDQTVINLTVNVVVNQNDNSRLDVTINKSTGNDFKNEYETKGAMELTAKKTLLGRILNSGEFTFELKDEKGNVLQRKQNVKDTITFDRITYTQDNMDRDEHGFIKDTVYKYTVSEVKGNAGGVTYDTKEYKITVTLHDNKDGTMNVKVEEEGQNPIEAIIAQYTFHNAFKNFYDAVGQGTFEGKKTLKGRQIKDGDEETVFTFIIKTEDGKEFTLTNTGSQIPYPALKYVVDSSLDPGTVMVPAWEDDSHKTIVVKAADLENIVEVVDANADPVQYQPKEYKYTVTEKAGTAAGITYDKTVYTVTAKVSVNANDNGKLDVDVKASPKEEVSFTNTYRARGEGTGKSAKFLYGRVLKDKEFTFEITDKAGKVLGTVVNDATGVIQYPVFRYIVDPDADNLGLWTEEDAEGHLITVTKVYDSKEDLEKDLTAEYKVRELKGDVDGNTEPGITYDTATVDTIKVAVQVTKDKLEEGVAKLDVKVETDSAAEFKNYYKARGEKNITGSKELTYRLPEDEEFEFVISGKDGEIARVKSSDMINGTHTGRTIKYPTFRYIVDYKAKEGTVYDADNNVIIVTVNWVEELKDGFTYTITEVDDGKDYFTYDTTEITLDVTVTPTGKEIEDCVEELDVKIEDSDGNDFHNKYHAKGALQLYAEKTLLGRILNSKDFTFELNRTDETFKNVIENVDTKENAKDGTVTFDLIEYDLDSMDKDQYGFVVDTKYYYTVSEVVPADAVENEDGTYTYNGVTYDNTVFQITATLHDNKKGLIQVSVEAKPEGELTFTELLKRFEFKFGNAFENFYHAEGEDTISGTKTLRGRKLKEGEYQFNIKDAEGTVLATVSNDADGNILYPTFRYVVNHLAEGTSYSYDEANNTLTLTTNNLEDMVTPVDLTADPVTYESKDYIYTIDEVIPEGAVDNGDGTYTYKGVTYNELGVNYTLTVTVEVNANDMGILDVTIDNPEGLDFSNVYRAKGEDTVVGKKTIKNANIEDFEGKFQFTVSDSEGNLITTVSTDKEGNILYPTFRYVVDPDAEAGAVYDEEANVYTVTVNAYEDLAEVYKYNVTEVEPETEEKDETLSNVAFNTGEITEYEISVTVVANDEDASILDVVALPNTEVDFVNTFYHKAGLYKVSENSGEALKGAVIRLVRVDDDTIIDEWTSDGTVHMINLIEIGEGTFRFVEVKSPSGYHLAKSIEFTQDKDGVLTSSYDHIYDKDGNAIFVMYDPKDANTGDSAPLAAAGGAFAVGLAGLAAVLAQRKKRRA